MFQLRRLTNYDKVYATTRLEALSWSPKLRILMLKLMMSKLDHSEAHWGAFDAMADLLGHIEPPKPGAVTI